VALEPTDIAMWAVVLLFKATSSVTGLVSASHRCATFIRLETISPALLIDLHCSQKIA
jgi:hypothetical protein